MDVSSRKASILVIIYFHVFSVKIFFLYMLVNFIFRYFVRLKSYVRNKAHPEGSMAEAYIQDECLIFCSRFIDGTTRFTRPPRNPDPSNEIKDLYMFGSAGEPIGKNVNEKQFDDLMLIQAHRYVLRHCDELEELRR